MRAISLIDETVEDAFSAILELDLNADDRRHVRHLEAEVRESIQEAWRRLESAIASVEAGRDDEDLR